MQEVWDSLETGTWNTRRTNETEEIFEITMANHFQN